MNRKGLATIVLLLLINLFVAALTVSGLGIYGPPPEPPPNRDISAPTNPLLTDTNTYQVHGRLPVAFGGGEWAFPDDHLPAEQRQHIEAILDKNIRQLTAAGELDEPAATTAVTLSWPLRPADYLNDYGYHGIANFVDQNPAFPYQRLDYACGQRTYDTYNGYNHPGTDIFTWPFPWNRMDNNEVQVVAAAAGTIIYRQDGNYDRNCSFTGQPWNAVYIQHADGSIAWYGHLKNGSVTPKGVGETVRAGDYLGIVGSSGSSTAPHLHLEIHNAVNAPLDPYAGVCNALNPESLWAEQPPYYDTAVNKITTGVAAPALSSCSTPEQSNEAHAFNPGDTIYFTTYYRDQLGSLPSQYTIYQPDGSVYQSWQHTIPSPHYAASWWWWSFDLEGNEPQGYWHYEVVVAGQTFTHTFLVGTPAPPPPPPPPPAPVITVTTPNGGEVITPGATLTISWQTLLTTSLQVDLWKYNGLYSATLTTTLPLSGSGRLTWTIPVTTPTTLYRIRVTDVLNPVRFDESDGDFIIGILDQRFYLPAVHKLHP